MHSAAEILSLLTQLDAKPADRLETQTLDFKEWDRRGTAQAVSAIIEHVVCMANGGGGTIVIGVHDKLVGRREAIIGVPGEIRAEEVRQSVFRRTSPQIMPTIEEVGVPEGTQRIFVIRVTGEEGPYTDSQGAAKIRIDNECLPFTGQRRAAYGAGRPGHADTTFAEVEGDADRLLSPSAMESLRQIAAKQNVPADLLRLSDFEFMRSIGLVSERGFLRAGAVLLAGRPDRIAELFPNYQWSFSRMKSSVDYDNPVRRNDSLAVAVERIEGLILPDNPVTTVRQGLLHLEFRRYPDDAVREALMNAFAHANYRIPGVIQIRLSDDRLEIANPGGFIGGVSEQNILRHAPVARNATLMNALISLRLCNRNNLGVKRMYHAMLLDGKEPPIHRDEGDAVRVIFLGSEFSIAFRAFVENTMLDGFQLQLEHLLVIHYLVRHGEIDLATASEIAQQHGREARESLRQLVVRKVLNPVKRQQKDYWRLSEQAALALREPSGVAGPLTKYQIAEKLALNALGGRERGMRSADFRDVTGLSAKDIKYLLGRMREKNLIQSTGSGPAAIWEFVGGEVGGRRQPPKVTAISALSGRRPPTRPPTPAKRKKTGKAAKE